MDRKHIPLRANLMAYMLLTWGLGLALVVSNPLHPLPAFLLCLLALIGLYVFSLLGNLEKAHDEAVKSTEVQQGVIDGAYSERNYLVALLARLYPSGIRPTQIPGWDPAWQNCVYIDLPSGQVSYHYHSSEAHLFGELPPYTRDWDGHQKTDVHNRLLANPTLNGLLQASWLDHWRAQYLNHADGCLEIRADEYAAIRMFCEKLDKDLTDYLGMRAFLKRYPEPDWAREAECHKREQYRRAVSSVSV